MCGDEVANQIFHIGNSVQGANVLQSQLGVMNNLFTFQERGSSFLLLFPLGRCNIEIISKLLAKLSFSFSCIRYLLEHLFWVFCYILCM